MSGTCARCAVRVRSAAALRYDGGHDTSDDTNHDTSDDTSDDTSPHRV